MTLLALLRLLVIRECAFVKRGSTEEDGDGEGNGQRGRWRGRERENVSMAAESGGFFSSSKLELQQRGFIGECGLPRFTKEREPQCVIPLFSS